MQLQKADYAGRGGSACLRGLFTCTVLLKMSSPHGRAQNTTRSPLRPHSVQTRGQVMAYSCSPYGESLWIIPMENPYKEPLLQL